MKNKLYRWILTASALVILAVLWNATPGGTFFKQAAVWQQLTSPGDLSAAHARLENDCAACHSSFGGIDEADCIACHALNERLLGWPENIFHADLGNCIGCHPEHLGRDLPPTRMDHTQLSNLILKRLKSSGSETDEPGLRVGQIEMWLRHQDAAEATAAQSFQLPAEERLLNCYACHLGSDIHAGLFGRDCAPCHQTQAWTIPGYRHPTGRSSDCFECHKAPKSHYKGHFKKMLGRVGDCYMCHSTPSWLDIGHPAWYRQWLKQLKVEEAESLFDE